MIRTATLLVVVTLTGTPVATLACVVLCGQPAMAASESACHNYQVAAPEGLSLSASHHCDMTLLDTPPAVKSAQRSFGEPMRHASTLSALSDILAPGRGGLGHLKPRPADAPLVVHCSYVILRI